MFLQSKRIWRKNFAGENITCNFRRSFYMHEKATEGIIAVSAHHYYRLWINGHTVGGLASPAPTMFQKRQRYLKYDITPYLTEGENVIAATVLYLGGNGQNHVKGTPCLIFDCEITCKSGTLSINSDTDCKCSDQTGYTQGMPMREARRLTGATRYDPEEEPEGWKYPGFDDSGWENAVISPAQILNPVLEEQEIPEGVIKHTVEVKQINRGDGFSVYDAGEVLTGFVRVVLKGRKGDIIRLRYSELLEGERNRHGYSEKNTATAIRTEHGASSDLTEYYFDEYVIKGAEREVWEENFTYKAFRYFELTGTEHTEILSVEAVKTGTDMSCKGSFGCDNALVNEMMRACVETQHNALQGSLVDCPHREQAQYLGDSMMQSRLLIYNFTYTHAMLRKVLQDFEDAQLDDGYFPFVAPGDWVAGNSFQLRMPEYDMLYVNILWDIYYYYDDIASVDRFYPTAARTIGYYLSLRDSTGLVPPNQEATMHISDWPYPTIDEKGDYLFVENIYLLRALRLLCKLAGLIHKPEDVLYWQTEHENLSCSIKKYFYDAEAGLFCDTPGSAHHHPGVNTLAAIEGLFPDGNIKTVCEKLISMPFETSIILSYDYLDLLFREGYRQHGFELISDSGARWGLMISEGSRNIREGFEDIESHSHAWGCYPMRLLQEYILGVVCTAPGFRKVKIEPFFPKSINSFGGSVLAPQGIISVSGEKKDRYTAFTIRIPEGVAASFEYSGTVLEYGEGEYTIEISEK